MSFEIRSATGRESRFNDILIYHYDFPGGYYKDPIKGSVISADLNALQLGFVQNRASFHDYIRTAQTTVRPDKVFPISIAGLSGGMNIKYEHDEANDKNFRIEVIYSYDEFDLAQLKVFLSRLCSNIVGAYNLLGLSEHPVEVVDFYLNFTCLGSKYKSFVANTALQLVCSPGKNLFILRANNGASRLISRAGIAAIKYKKEA